MPHEVPPPISTIPGPPRVPSKLEPPKPGDFAIPAVRVWFYAGPIVIDALAMLCTTLLVALKILPVDNFKYLVGVLVVGNVALRVPGASKAIPPGGGGFIVAFISTVLRAYKL